MAVYRFYYGANAEEGIGVKAQSPELERLPLASELKELASMHALESSEHSGEMLSFLLEREGYSILGVSYIESPKSSGYNRSAPCSLQYIAPMKDLENASAELNKLINFVNFQKPSSAAPQALNRWPMNESGYFYHNSPSLLAPLVDGMARVALSERGEILLIGLPKGKNSEYAFARYTIAELMAYLPVPLRANIRFFTGLPAAAESGDAVSAFDSAVRFGANVIFCPNEYYRKLTSSRSCIGVDMEAPGRNYGAFAEYISHVPDISDGLTAVDSILGGKVTYETLNRAGQQAMEGKVVTIDSLREELGRKNKTIREYEKQIDNGNQEYYRLKQEYEKLEARSREQAAWTQPSYERTRTVREEPKEKNSGLKWILIGLIGLVLAAGGFFLGREVFPKEKAQPAAAQEQAAQAGEEQAAVQEMPAPIEEKKEEAAGEADGQRVQEETPADPAETDSGETEKTPDDPTDLNDGEPAGTGTEQNETPGEEIEPVQPENSDGDLTAGAEDPADGSNAEDPEREQAIQELKRQYPNLAKLLEDKQAFRLNKTYKSKQFDTKQLVIELQKRLRDLGYDIGTSGANHDGVDGDYGTSTTEAVRQFRMSNGLEEQDYADRETIEKILSPDAQGPVTVQEDSENG